MYITNMITLTDGAKFTTDKMQSEYLGEHYVFKIHDEADDLAIFFKTKEQMQNMALALMVEIQKDEVQNAKPH